jgi:hypothetical protein
MKVERADPDSFPRVIGMAREKDVKGGMPD